MILLRSIYFSLISSFAGCMTVPTALPHSLSEDAKLSLVLQAHALTTPAHLVCHQPKHHARSSLGARQPAPQPLLEAQTPGPHPALASFTISPQSEAPTCAGAGHLHPHAPHGFQQQAAVEEEEQLPEELLLLLPDGPPYAFQHDLWEAGGSPAAAAVAASADFRAPGLLRRAATAEPEDPLGLVSGSRECLKDSEPSASGGGTSYTGSCSGGWGGCADEGACDVGRCPGRFEAVVDEAAAAATAFWDPFHDDWEHWTTQPAGKKLQTRR
jgi:hypothetical protein